MGMFDSVYAEITCPFCGYEYKYNPPSYEQAKSILATGGLFLVDDIVDNEKTIADYRAFKNWGLCEIQLKEWDCVLSEYYVGDEVKLSHYGHYFIEDNFTCDGCCLVRGVNNWQPTGAVSVWVEIEDYLIKSVKVTRPDTGQAERRLWNKEGRDKDVVEYKPTGG